MNPTILFLFWITVVSGIIIGDGGGYSYSGSQSASSEEDHYGGHGDHGGYGGGGHGGRPPRPPVVSSKCEDGWTRFDRPQGPWCMKVFYAKQNYQTGVSFCAAMGANVSGYQNAEERMFVANTGRTLQAQQGEELLGEVWVGAIRNPACSARGVCSPSDQFQWTDGHTTGSDGILWGPGEPNVIHPYDKVTQDCLVMHTSAADGQIARWNFGHGQMDDSLCWYGWTLIACGKRPEPR
ncbi:hypothetical protein B9Z55_003647 [Caenorhabditis nigoni]|uniref:C-type lectin domain-containing protein n=1 Tax=Caenorhabditis nigoni TaxID=1611254 RepID=A0A2G5VS22_9PELO|nr:hypothetical protein B9Z55_003647 [Caenorhabditis nigoni]